MNTRNSSPANGFVRMSAWLSLLWERTWPICIPAFMVICVFLTFAWAGGWNWLQHLENSVWLWVARGVFLIAGVWAISHLRHFQRPTESDLIRRIEKSSQLEHRPVTAQSDPIAMGDGDTFAQALWQEHRDRMARELSHLTGGKPEPKANRFDPLAIRAVLPVLVFAAFFFSFSPNGGRLSDAYLARTNEVVIPTRIDAWVNPPPYTRKPPIFLTMENQSDEPKSINAPVGSEFFLRFIGSDDIQLHIDSPSNAGTIDPVETDKASSDREFRFFLEEATAIRLMKGEKLVSQWGISVVPDQPPQISFVEHPSAALSGSLQLSYEVEDDYGVVKARADIKPVEAIDKNARPLVGPPKLDLSLPRLRAKKGVSRVNKDLTEHPWAGSKVTIRLEAEDDRGQIGESETREITLPGRRFSNPLAQAMVEQRRILAMDANEQLYVSNLLDAVSRAAEDRVENGPAILGMRVAYRRLVDARTDNDLRSTLDLLWEIALGIEYGDLSEAERKLREAQERLSEALENGATDEEIDRLMQELREAMNEMMQALAEQARNNPIDQNPFDQNAQTLSQNDLQQMMDRIEDLAKSGSKDAARQLLSEMQRMMDNLRAGRHQQQRQTEGNQLNQTLDKLSELMRRQQELMNETYRMQRQQEQGLRPNRGERQRQQGQQQQGQQQQGQRQQGQQQQGGNQGENQQQGQGGEMSAEELAEALENLRQQQEALQQQLSELGQQLDELGLGQPEELGRAQDEMGQAGENLGQGNTAGAATDQGEALEALRQGAQNMMQQMAGDRQQGGSRRSENGGQGQAGQRRGSDPLGRENGGEGVDANTNVEIPGEIDAQRARRILEAIRERLAIPENPLIEKDYLERLLKIE